MAQVMVNFRMDEEVKKSMEQACREMGLTMTTAFTIFATKVGKEKRIPFEVTAQPHASGPCQQYRRTQTGQGCGTQTAGPAHRQEQLELLCTEIRRSLTAIHTAIPSSITGLSIEHIRLLCGDELKDKALEISRIVKGLSSNRNAELLKTKDPGVLDEYAQGLSSIGSQLGDIAHTLIPAMKSCPGGDVGDFTPYEQQLTAVSQKFDDLAPVMQRFLHSTACNEGALAVQARVQQAAKPVETAYVLTALASLDALILRHYNSLEASVKARLESDYLPTLELTLGELGQAEQDGGDVGVKAALCLRVVNMLSQVISDSSRARQEWSGRSLEAEVAALERLAAMRGDITDGMKPEG